MSDLVAFLRARLDEDEQIARDAAARVNAWAPDLPPWETTRYLGKFGTNLDHHITRWNPARVLAEVEAKRRIVDEVAPEMETIEWVRDQEFATSSDPTEYQSTKLLRLLTSSYADHPDYDPAWAVETAGA